MTAFPKADVQNAGVGVEPNVCLWPKADVQKNPARHRMHISGERRTVDAV